MTQNNDGTFTYTDEDGVTTVIDIKALETNTSIADNGDGTFTFTNEDGVTTTIDTRANSNPFTPTAEISATNVQAAIEQITITGTTGSIFFAGTDGKPTEDNAQLFWNDTNNRLGVGTASPSHKLHVTGTTRTEGIINTDGTASEPSYRYNDDSDTGIYRPAADEIAISVGGIAALKVEEVANATKVTINETLELDGKVLDEDNSAGTAGQVLTATATGTKWVDTNPMKAAGKVAANGTAAKVKGATVSKTIKPDGTTATSAAGVYYVKFTTAMPDADYIIQLTLIEGAGVGNDNYAIAYSNQTTTGFTVKIGDNDNGSNARALRDLEFMFTVMDF